MVMGFSTRLKLPQEQLDQLCQTAVDLLTGDIASQFLAGSTETIVQSAVLIDGNNVELFFRSAIHPAEVLCCDCTTQIDIRKFTETAQYVLAIITEAS